MRNQIKNKSMYILKIAGVSILLIVVFLFISLLKWQPKTNPADEMEILKIAAKQLGKNPNDFTEEDFKQITELTLGYIIETSGSGPAIYDMKLSNLNALKKFTNLEKLTLMCVSYPKESIPKWMIFLSERGIVNLNNKFALDLTPLKELNNLEELEIDFTPVKDLKPIAKLTNLRRLSIYNNVSYAQIANMRHNKGNIIPGNLSNKERPLVDLGPLAKLSNLEELSTWNSMLKNLKPLSEIPNLRKLNLSCTNISDIAPLSGCTNLHELNISETNVSDLTPISNIPDLRKLNICLTKVSNLKPLSNVISLQDLDIYTPDISNLEPLKSLKNLKRIRIYNSDNITIEEILDLKQALPNMSVERSK